MNSYKLQLSVAKPNYLTDFQPSPNGWDRFGFWLNANCDSCGKELGQVLVPYTKQWTSDHEYVNYFTECEECENSCRITVESRNSNRVVENRMQHDQWITILQFTTKGCVPRTLGSIEIDANEEWVAHSRQHGVDTKTFLLTGGNPWNAEVYVEVPAERGRQSRGDNAANARMISEKICDVTVSARLHPVVN